VLGLIVGNVSLIFGEQLLSLYLTDDLAIAEGLVRMKATFPLYFIGGIMNSITGFIRGTGFSIFPTIINLIGICGVRIVWVFTVFQIPEFHTITVLFISWPLSWFVVSISLLVYYFVYAKKRIELQCELTSTETVKSEAVSA
jgi:Na+-driven multidrug efflux pump